MLLWDIYNLGIWFSILVGSVEWKFVKHDMGLIFTYKTKIIGQSIYFYSS
jgi:hypothetical protein